MSKIIESIAILTDTHSGVRGDSEIFANHQREFYTDTFFPTCIARGIEKVLHLGDYFDRRKYINYRSLLWNKEMFINPLVENGMEMTMIVGNHDIALRNSNSINGPELLFGNVPQIRVLTSPEQVVYGKTKILLVPWINNENYKSTMEVIKKSKAHICAGHFELAGFEMHKGQVCEEGMKSEGFNKFVEVWSGHFHHRSKKGNIEYLGTSMEFTWQDYGDQKGFYLVHFHEDGTFSKEYIKTPQRMFFKYEYDDSLNDITVDDVVGDDNIAGKYVKLVVTSKKEPYKLDLFVEQMTKKSPYELQIVDLVDISSTQLTEEEQETEAKETIAVLCDYVDGMSSKQIRDEKKGALKKLLRDLHAASLTGDDDE